MPSSLTKSSDFPSAHQGREHYSSYLFESIQPVIIMSYYPSFKTITYSAIILGSGLMLACKNQCNTETNNQVDTSPGRIIPNGEVPTPADIERDAKAAIAIIERNAPNGVITIFGSARAKEGMTSYDQTREFAKQWSLQHGEEFPIMTGGSHGIMEAGNRGAMEANAKSLYFATYFKGGVENAVNKYVTDGYIAASFTQRESDLVDYAVGIICAPGGVGTSWEIFESLSKIQTRKKNPCPVILLGSKEIWQPLMDYMHHLDKIGTISPDDIDLLQLAETPEQAVKILQQHLKLNNDNVRKNKTNATAPATGSSR